MRGPRLSCSDHGGQGKRCLFLGMLVEVAHNPDDPADQDRCGRDLRALEPMPGRDRNRDNRESSALVKLPCPSARKDVASPSRPFNSAEGLMEADRLNAPLADAGGGRQGQGRGGRGAEVRAAWGAAADPGAEGPGRVAPRSAPAGGGPPQVRPDAGWGYGAAKAASTALARVISSAPGARKLRDKKSGTMPASGAFVEPGRAGLAQSWHHSCCKAPQAGEGVLPQERR